MDDESEVISDEAEYSRPQQSVPTNFPLFTELQSSRTASLKGKIALSLINQGFPSSKISARLSLPLISALPDDPIEDTEESDYSLSLVQKSLDSVLRLYEEDKIFEAWKLWKSLEIPFPKTAKIESLEEDYREIRRLLSHFQDNTDWNLVATGPIRVFTKISQGLPTISVKSEGDLDISIWHLLSLFYESDLYYKWLPFCKESRTLKTLSRARKLVYQYFKLPIIEDREILVHGYGVNILKEAGVVMVISQSLPNQPYFKGYPVPPETPNRIRATVNFCGTLIKPLGRSKVHMSFISNCDPLLRHCPYKLLNWFSQKFAKKMFKTVAKQARKFEGSEHQARMNGAGNREFYDYIRASLEEYYAQGDF